MKLNTYSQCWAIRPRELFLLTEAAHWMTRGVEDPQLQSKISALKRGRPPRISGSVAVLPIRGAITNRADFFSALFGDSAIETLSEDFAAMVNNQAIGAIVLDIDSPGGSVAGVQEFAHQILQARGVKKIIAVANTDAASAAYWIASAAEEIVVTPSGSVGSIGVFAVHSDFSDRYAQAGVKNTLIKAGKYKAEGNPYQPLNEEAQAALQTEVDQYYSHFVAAVAQGRGVKAAQVRNGFGEGRMVLAQDAVKAGMADRVGTLAETLVRLGVKGDSERKRLASALEDPEILAAETTPEAEMTGDDDALAAELRQRELDMF